MWVMRLQELTEVVGARFDGVVDVSSIVVDSRKVVPGSVFVAYKGVTIDGHEYVNQAVEKGAVAVVGERPMELPVPYFQVSSGRLAWAKMVAKWYGNPEKKLKIVGEGSEINKLKSMSKANIEFLGFRNENEKIQLLQNCKALIFPGEEDFGLTPVEAMACGRPVIAYGKGGVTETVVDGGTGMFFYDDTPESLNNAVNQFESEIDKFKPEVCRSRAELFSKDRFITEFKKIVNDSFATNHS